MGFVDFISVTSTLLLWNVYLVFQCLFTTLRNLVWRLKGTYQQVLDSEKPENYAKSAHVHKILFSYRLDAYVESTLNDWGLLHDRFESPEFVLRDDVILATINDKEAIFVQKKEGSSPFEIFPFVIMAIHDAPHRVITMPLSSFNRLVEESLPPIDGKLVFLHNQARCGGTLFTEMFKASGKCLTSCESHVLNAVCKYHYIQEKWDAKKTKYMLKNVVHMLCKPRNDLPEKPTAYVVKPTCFAIICADLIQEVYPEAVQLFIYRDPVKTALSIRRLCAAIPSLGMFTVLPNIPRSAAFWVRVYGYVDVDFRNWSPKSHLEISWGFRVAAMVMMRYLRYREKGIRMTGIRYEVTLDHTQRITKKMFELCGIPQSAVEPALEAVGRDSQEGSPVSRAILKKLHPNEPIATPEYLAEMQAMCEEYNLPSLNQWSDQAFVVPGSITP